MTKLNIKKLVGCLPLLVLVACASTSETRQDMNEPEGVVEVTNGVIVASELPLPDQNAINRRAQNAVFQIGDTVEMEVYRVPSVSGQYVVNSFGLVEFPLIGELKVENVTTKALSEKLEALYGERYLQDPDIVVKRVAARIGKVIVDGAVGSPGVYDLFESIRLSEAIALAGGTSDAANLRRVLVLRSVNDARYVTEYNLVDIREKGGQDPFIFPEDAIFVDNRQVFRSVRDTLLVLPLFSLFLR